MRKLSKRFVVLKAERVDVVCHPPAPPKKTKKAKKAKKQKKEKKKKTKKAKKQKNKKKKKEKKKKNSYLPKKRDDLSRRCVVALTR